MPSNELQRLHFECKRLNTQLEHVRTQLKGTVETVAELRTQIMHLRNKVFPSVPEAVPEGVSAAVPESKP